VAYSRFNIAAFLWDYITYFAGTSLLSAITILPLFASEVADRAPAIAAHRSVVMALIPTGFAFGALLPQILGAHLVTGRTTYRPFLVKVGIVERLCQLGCFVSMAMLAHSAPVWLLCVPIGFFFLWATAMGVNHPAYTAMLEHTIPADLRGRVFGFGAALGGVVGSVFALIAKRLLSVLPFPYGFVACAGIAFVVLTSGLVPLAFVRETPFEQPPVEEGGSFAARLRGLLRDDPAYGRYLLSQVFFAVPMMTSAIWTGYALKRFHATGGDVAMMAAVMSIASGGGYLVTGWLADRFGNRAVLLWSTLATALAILLAWGAPTLPLYIATFVPLRLADSGWQLTNFNILMDFAPRGRVHTYTAVAAAVPGPFRVLAPLMGGVLVAELGRHGPVFAASAVFTVAAAWVLLTVPERRL
jgi:MFS family permease